MQIHKFVLIFVAYALSFSCNALSEEMQLEVTLQKRIMNLTDAENQGLKFLIEEDENSEVLSVNVCKVRKNIPEEVSLAYLLTSKSSQRVGRRDMLISIVQQMETRNLIALKYDFGRFEIKRDLLPYLSLSFFYSYDDSNFHDQVELQPIYVDFFDIVTEILSEERAFYIESDVFFSDDLNPSCGLKSGRYFLKFP